MRHSRHLVTVLLSFLGLSQGYAGEKKTAPPPQTGKGAAFRVPEGVLHHPDLTYRTVTVGKQKLQLQLDVARPAQGAGPFPAVIILHGAGPLNKGRQANLPLAFDLAGRGYVAIAVSYRHEARHKFSDPIHDVQAAVRWLRANAARYKIDKKRVGALGYSVGGGLACLLGLTQPKDGLDEKGPHAESARVQAVVSYCPPTDLAGWHKACVQGKVALGPGIIIKAHLESWLGGPPNRAAANYASGSPVNYAWAGAAPVLLLHGSADNVVPLEQSELLDQALRKKKADVTLFILKGVAHDIDKSAEAQLTVAAAVAFLDRHLNAKPVRRK
jgi:acetyl esterase/lipase